MPDLIAFLTAPDAKQVTLVAARGGCQSEKALRDGLIKDVRVFFEWLIRKATEAPTGDLVTDVSDELVLRTSARTTSRWLLDRVKLKPEDFTSAVHGCVRDAVCRIQSPRFGNGRPPTKALQRDLGKIWEKMNRKRGRLREVGRWSDLARAHIRPKTARTYSRL